MSAETFERSRVVLVPEPCRTFVNEPVRVLSDSLYTTSMSSFGTSSLTNKIIPNTNILNVSQNYYPFSPTYGPWIVLSYVFLGSFRMTQLVRNIQNLNNLSDGTNQCIKSFLKILSFRGYPLVIQPRYRIPKVNYEYTLPLATIVHIPSPSCIFPYL